MKDNFGKNLRASRISAKISMKGLADLIGVSKNAIQKYEKGEMFPSSIILITIAKVLKIDVNELVNGSNHESFIFENIQFREEKDIKEKVLDTVKSKATNYLKRYFELETIANEKVPFTNPLKDFTIKEKKDTILAAKYLRKKWRLGLEPIFSVIELLETHGIKVCLIDADSSFNGLSAWIDKIPIIVLNKRIKEITRLRFTAIHELAHILFEISHSNSNKKLERYCDNFAGVFLYPREKLREDFKRDRTKISMLELIQVKEKYGISIQAIMVSAMMDGIISNENYKIWNNQKTLEKSFGSFRGHEESIRYKKILLRCINENLITQSKASYLLEASTNEFEKKIAKDKNIILNEK